MLMLGAAVLLTIGFFLPWVLRTPRAVTSGIPRSPFPAVSARPLDYLSITIFCLPLALVLPILSLAGAGLSIARHGGANRPPLDLVVAACAIGGIFAILLAGLMSTVWGVHAPPYTMSYQAGFWLTVSGYVVAFSACLISRRRRPRQTA